LLGESSRSQICASQQGLFHQQLWANKTKQAEVRRTWAYWEGNSAKRCRNWPSWKRGMEAWSLEVRFCNPRRI
jgi:hypothetical protein